MDTDMDDRITWVLDQLRIVQYNHFDPPVATAISSNALREYVQSKQAQ